MRAGVGQGRRSIQGRVTSSPYMRLAPAAQLMSPPVPLSPPYLRRMHVQHGDDGGIDVVGLRRPRIQDVYGIAPARHLGRGRQAGRYVRKKGSSASPLAGMSLGTPLPPWPQPGSRTLALSYLEDGRIVKVLAELLRVHGGRGDEQLEVGPEARNVLDEAKQDVGVQRALVRLVDHHDTARAQEVGRGGE